MKIKIFVSILIIIIVSLILINNEKKYDNVDYLNDIYNQICNEDFFAAKIKSSSILLEDGDFNIIKEIKVESKEKRIKVKSIIKENEQFYFIIKGSGDDNEGILFVNKDFVDMQGVYSLRRINGNSYYYKTY